MKFYFVFEENKKVCLEADNSAEAVEKLFKAFGPDSNFDDLDSFMECVEMMVSEEKFDTHAVSYGGYKKEEFQFIR